MEPQSPGMEPSMDTTLERLQTSLSSQSGNPRLIRGLLKRWKPAAAVVDGAQPLLTRVLTARGLADPAQASQFLEPSLKQLHNPSLLPDLDRAAERILAAARARESIVIYGDYDVDGITATAILFHTLRALEPAAPVSSYIPHRVEEGYGLNTQAIQSLAAKGAKVIISVDCGVTAVGPAAAAKAAGVDLIITDHHNLPHGPLPDAYSIVHPMRPGSQYPFGELCGAGVAFKLAWRLCTLASGSERVSEPLRALLLELLALTSLGVIADIVPLVGENRVIAHAGLRRIKHSKIEGLRALVEASGLSGDNVGEEDVGFKIGPRLNACGRMDHARDAVELLTTATGPRAIEIAEQLTRLNNQRRATELAIFHQACELAEAAGMTAPDRRAIVLAHPDWHAGVVGIVCSRLVERYGRPTILMCSQEGMCHGSGRSIDGFSLHAGLESCAVHLTSFGGHDMAAGLRLAADKLPAFTDSFTAKANAGIDVESLTPCVGFDADADVGELTLPVAQQLARMSPFGRGNPQVRLRLPAVRVATHPQTLGQNNRHLALQVASTGAAAGRLLLRLVAWGWAERIAHLPAGRVLDVLIEPRISEWKGNVKVEGTLLDICPID
jgi:single-stranded-DNA-specific exonuclease